MEEILTVLLDALLDSLKVLGVVIVVYIILSFVETKISKALEKNHHMSPLLGSAFGLIPQCGFSVVASDLYIKNHITMGTLLAVFITCSDEALPIMLSNFEKAYMVLPLLGIKFVLGFIVGYLTDFIAKKSEEVKYHFMKCNHKEEIHIGCCGHEIDNEHEEGIHKHLWHPLIHSLKIFAYVLVINIIFGLLIYFIGEDNIAAALTNAKYFTPLIASLVGLIPNCASSVIITELYTMGNISFGTTIAGLICNAGLGILVLLKDKKMYKKTLIIVGILLLTSLITGYTINLIFGF